MKATVPDNTASLCPALHVIFDPKYVGNESMVNVVGELELRKSASEKLQLSKAV